MDNAKVAKQLAGVFAAAALSVGAGAATAAPAQASSNVWDRVASCESGGNWHINTGNGFYGGLQFSRSTWRAYGGGAFASTANRASRSEQIAIARRTLASQGPQAWPVCSRHAGLTRSNGGASSHASAPVSHHSAPASHHSAKSATPKRASYKAPLARGAYTGKSMKVRRGDTLSEIASRYHVRGGWRALWKLNQATVNNPNQIWVGQVLRIK